MKKFLTKILCFISFICIIYLTLSFSIDSTFDKITSLGSLNSSISNKIVDSIADSLDGLSGEEISKIKSSIVHNSKINLILNRYLEQLLIDLQNSTTSDIDVSEELHIIIDESVEGLSPSLVKYIYAKADSIDFNKIYKNILEYARSEIKINLRPYIIAINYLKSILYRVISIIITALCIAGIIVLTKNKLELLSIFSLYLLLLGGLLLVLTIFLRQIFSYAASSMFGSVISLEFGGVAIVSITSIILGYIFKDIYEKHSVN